MSANSAETIFTAARELAPEFREAYLKPACGEDSELRNEVDALLRADEASDDLLDVVVPTHPSSDAWDTLVGRKIGHYKLLQKIGEGGYGVVYMAEQETPVSRRVALKVIKPGMDSAAVIARFEAERQALAMMQHSSIATVFDGGSINGRPYFVMELVKGVPITEYCDANALPTKDRLELFVSVCLAVQHAHGKGIIHRDIKPSNVMVTLHDGQPVVKVIDFGVAKAIHQKLTEQTMFTAYGQMIGTPQYMSPEQAEMSGLDIDIRCDVYSLGVLMYELVTGAAPLTEACLREASFAELQRLIRELEPLRPSQQLSTTGDALTVIAKHRSVSPDRLMRLVQGDMDWVVMKALDKDRRRRYETVRDFAADVKSLLTHQAVAARPPSVVYKIAKFVRRYRIASTLLLVCIIATVVTTFGLAKALAAEHRSAIRLDKLVAAQAKLNQAVATSQKLRDRAKIEADQATLHAQVAHDAAIQAESLRLAAEASRLTTSDPGLALSLSVKAAETARQRNSYHNSVILDAIQECRELRAFDLRQLANGTSDYSYPISCHPIHGLNRVLISFAHSPIGAIGFDIENGEELFRMELPAIQFDLIAVSPTGELAATVSDSARHVVFSDGTKHAYTGRAIRLWSLTTGKELRVLRGHRDLVQTLQFSADGNTLLSASLDGTARTWNVQTGEAISILKTVAKPEDDGMPLLIARFNATESRVVGVIGNQATTAGFGKPRAGYTQDPRIDFHRTATTDERGSGTRITPAVGHPKVVLWDAKSAELIASQRILGAHQSDISVGFFPDDSGTLVVYDRGAKGHSANFYNCANGEQIESETNRDIMEGIQRGGTLLTASVCGHELVIFRQSSEGQFSWMPASCRPVLRRKKSIIAQKCTGDPATFGAVNSKPAILVRQGNVVIVQPLGEESGAPIQLRGHRHRVMCATQTNASEVVSIDEHSQLRVWTADQESKVPRRITHPVPRTGADSWARFTKTSAAILWGQGYSNTEFSTHNEQFVLQPTRSFDSVFLSNTEFPDRHRTFLPRTTQPARSGVVQFLSELAGQAASRDLYGGLVSFDVSSDGSRLLTIHDDINLVDNFDEPPASHSDYQPVRVWDIDSGEMLYGLAGFRNTLRQATFSHDGSRIATIESARFNLATVGGGHSGGDNRSHFGAIDIWKAETGSHQRRLLTPLEEPSVLDIVWRPGSHHVLCDIQDSTQNCCILFDADSGHEISRLERRGHEQTVFTPDGMLVGAIDRGNAVVLWNATSGGVFATLKPDQNAGISSFTFSADSKRIIAACNNGTATVWDLETLNTTLQISDSDRRLDIGRFSPDGKWIVTAGRPADTARIWNSRTGEEWLRIPYSNMTSAQFSPDSRQLLTTGVGVSPELWPVDPLASAQNLKPRQLSDAELKTFFPSLMVTSPSCTVPHENSQ